jgi:very-short-patch-repair endonuclease
MVDAPAGEGGQLALRQTEAFKQRYNVAASRARDLLWLVHSLEPSRDLKAGDLRRLLIEHVRDPRPGTPAALGSAGRAASPFERAVKDRLVALGYRVDSQVWVGRHRLDMVVSDRRCQVALECDGDRFQRADQIPEDMARQAVLERAGWRFIRIRSTRYYRSPDETMARVCDELTRLGVGPFGLVAPDAAPASRADELRDRIVKRAESIMREQRWLPAASTPALPAPT